MPDTSTKRAASTTLGLNTWRVTKFMSYRVAALMASPMHSDDRNVHAVSLLFLQHDLAKRGGLEDTQANSIAGILVDALCAAMKGDDTAAQDLIRRVRDDNLPQSFPESDLGALLDALIELLEAHHLPQSAKPFKEQRLKLAQTSRNQD